VLAEAQPITLEESVPSNGEVREYVVAKFPIPGEAGGPPSLCGIATDITDQTSATTTWASVFAPRLIEKVPAIGQRSVRALMERGSGMAAGVPDAV
jgi:hypothetical protein